MISAFLAPLSFEAALVADSTSFPPKTGRARTVYTLFP